MLKSTHRTANPLPDGWTEHKAPTGHSYYYHAASKTSTYKRPQISADSAELSLSSHPSWNLDSSLELGSDLIHPSRTNNHGSGHWTGERGFAPPGSSTSRNSRPSQYEKRQPEDRPKSKKTIPDCAPWVLIYTKLGRRFVHNPDTGQSLWRFPSDVLRCVIDLDRKERERREHADQDKPEDEDSSKDLKSNAEDAETKAMADATADEPKAKDYDSDEYEEIEVTDDEGEGVSKRARLDDDGKTGPVEFNEDDIAYQLAAMGQDEDELGEGEWPDGDDEEPPLDEADAKALFIDLLEDSHVNPFTPWETIVEEGKIIDDERYTCLPNMKARRETWGEWSRVKMQVIKEEKAKQERIDPRIPYLALLHDNATPKLYWAEFKRKYRKEVAMRDTKLLDRDREKLYRDHINRLKLDQAALRADLTALLKSQSSHVLNRASSIEALPTTILADLRYISLPARTRDPLIETYIGLLPPPPTNASGSAQETAEQQAQYSARQRREQALAAREARVREAQRRQRGALQLGRHRLREEQEELEQAKQIGKEGFRSQVDAMEE